MLSCYPAKEHEIIPALVESNRSRKRKKKQFRTGGSRNRIAMDFVKIEEQLNGNSLIHSIFFVSLQAISDQTTGVPIKKCASELNLLVGLNGRTEGVEAET